jgi:hypothetical protein
MVAGLVWISSAQKTRTIPGWHLPVTIEVTRDVEVKSSASLTHEARGTLYTWTRHSPPSFWIKRGERFQMVKIYYEGECRIRFKDKEYGLSSCHWLPGFRDAESDIYHVLDPPR